MQYNYQITVKQDACRALIRMDNVAVIIANNMGTLPAIARKQKESYIDRTVKLKATQIEPAQTRPQR